MNNVWSSDWHVEWNIERRGNWKLKFKLKLWFGVFTDMWVLLNKKKKLLKTLKQTLWRVTGKIDDDTLKFDRKIEKIFGIVKIYISIFYLLFKLVYQDV